MECSTWGQMIFVILMLLNRHLELSKPASHVVDDEAEASQGHTELIVKPVLKTRFPTVFYSSLFLEIHKQLKSIRHLII